MRRLALCILGLLLSATALAQTPTLTLTATTTVGAESVIPDLTWSTLPTATSCSASGAWTGAKGSMGHEVLSAVTSNATFTLTCQWPQDSTATLTWTNPTKNTDNTNYTNPQDVIIKYQTATSPPAFTNSAPPCAAPVTCIVVTPPTTTTRAITGFTTAGTVYFTAMARNTAGVISDPSMSASKVFSGAGATDVRSVSITVNAKPATISGLGVQ